MNHVERAAAPEAQIKVFEPHLHKLPPLRPYLDSLWDRRRFILTKASMDLKARHFDTAIGQLWMILDPLLLAAVYFLLIGILSGGASATLGRFTLLIASVFLFYFTKDSVIKGAQSVVGGGRMILNSAFPRALLPVSATLESLLELLPSLLLYCVIHLAAGRPLGAGLLLFPLLLAIHTVFNLGAAMLFGALSVYFRDTTSLLPHVIRIWMYVTPILYHFSDPEGALRAALFINPLYPLFSAYQTVLLGDVPTSTQILSSLAWAAGSLVVGAYVFLSRERDFAIRI